MITVKAFHGKTLADSQIYLLHQLQIESAISLCMKGIGAGW
jgi:hypothetical protein